MTDRHSNYDCLREAAQASGYDLPPIKSGTDASIKLEVGAPHSENPPSEIASGRYQTPDDRQHDFASFNRTNPENGNRNHSTQEDAGDENGRAVTVAGGFMSVTKDGHIAETGAFSNSPSSSPIPENAQETHAKLKSCAMVPTS